MKNVVILLGGISPERYISYRSGWAVSAALESLGYTVVRCDPAYGKNCVVDSLPALPSAAPAPAELAAFNPREYIECINSPILANCDIVVNMLHGPYGEDGTVQTLLELCKIPYTGSNALACRLAMDKARAKLLFAARGIPTPAWVTVEKGTALTSEFLDELREQFRQGMVIKPNCGGSTIGVSIVTTYNLDDIETAIKCAWEYDRTALVEAYIPGRELTVAILNDRTLPIIEIVPKDGFYDYMHKYTTGMSDYRVPAELDDMLAEFVSTLALTAHHVLGCKGITRVDFRLDEDGQAWCLEVNTIPGMTETSLVPRAAQAAGIPFVELCHHLVESA